MDRPPRLAHHEPTARGAAERLPPVVGAVQGTAVPPDQTFEHVAVFVVHRHTREHTDPSDARGRRVHAWGAGDVPERGHALDGQEASLTHGDGAVPLLVQIPQAPPRLEIGAELMPERGVHARIQRLLAGGAFEDRAAVRRRRAGRRAEPLVDELRELHVPAVVPDIPLEVEPGRRAVLQRQPPDEAIRDVGPLDILQRVQGVLVLRAAALQVGADVQPPERIDLVHVHDRRHARESEERLAAALLVEPILGAAAVGRAQADVPLRADRLVDVGAERVAPEALEISDRPRLVDAGRAGVIAGGSVSASQVDTVAGVHVRIDRLCHGVVVRTGPGSDLEPLAPGIAGVARRGRR